MGIINITGVELLKGINPSTKKAYLKNASEALLVENKNNSIPGGLLLETVKDEFTASIVKSYLYSTKEVNFDIYVKAVMAAKSYKEINEVVANLKKATQEEKQGDEMRSVSKFKKANETSVKDDDAVKVEEVVEATQKTKSKTVENVKKLTPVTIKIVDGWEETLNPTTLFNIKESLVELNPSTETIKNFDSYVGTVSDSANQKTEILVNAVVDIIGTLDTQVLKTLTILTRLYADRAEDICVGYESFVVIVLISKLDMKVLGEILMAMYTNGDEGVATTMQEDKELMEGVNAFYKKIDDDFQKTMSLIDEEAKKGITPKEYNDYLNSYSTSSSSNEVSWRSVIGGILGVAAIGYAGYRLFNGDGIELEA